MSTKKPTTSNGIATATPESNVKLEIKKSKAERNSSEDYSGSSLIARAYSAGYFPSFTHQRLFHSIVKLLNGKHEGSIDFNKLLNEANMRRSSALQIIRHMVNWQILEVSFNSSQTIGEKRKSWAFVRIIRNLETNEGLSKSA